MSTTTNVNQIKLNIMTKEQYDSATKSPTELYMVTDADPEGQTIQVDTLPEASESEVGKIYQYVGETDLNYTNGYFYKCFEYESGESGESPYYWEQIEVQPAGSSLPSQTGNAGKFLTTDGTNASWGNTVRNVTFNTSNGSNVFNETFYKKSTNDERFVISYGSSVDINTHLGWSFGKDPFDSTKHIFFYENNAGGASYTAHPIIGKSNRKFENLYITTVNNGSDITVPSVGGSLALQIATLPTADSTYEGTIYQYTGTTDANYTHGYLYECVSDGAATPTYSWSAVQVQAGGGSLPSQTGNAGKFLTTDGTDASWSDKPLVNKTTSMSSIHITPAANPDDIQALSVCVGEATRSRQTSSVCVGWNSIVDSTAPIGVTGYCTAIGSGSQLYGHHQTFVGGATRGGSNSSYCIGIGAESQTAGNIHGAIQLGKGTNSESGTLYVSQTTDGTTFTNTKLLDSDGTVPTDRYTTTPSSDGNYVPTLSISSGTATRSWTSIASSVSSSSTNAETVGAKLFYDTVGDIVTLINAL